MKNEEKSLVKDIQYNCRYTFNGTACNLNQKWSNNKWKFESKSIEREKKNYNWIPSTCILENCRYLRINANTSVIVFDEIINAKDSVSTNVVNTVSTNMTKISPTNVTSTVSTNFHNKNV